MARVSKNTAIKLARIAKAFDSYKQAYQYVDAVGVNAFYFSFRNEVGWNMDKVRRRYESEIC